MKKLLFLFGAFIFAIMVRQIKAQDWETFPVSKKQVTKNVILYKTGLTGAYPNMVAINTSKGVVVVDALPYPEVARRVRGMIEKAFGTPIAALINTHGAFDHTAGNEVFDDVPIYGHKNVKTEIERFIAIGKTPQYRQFFEGELAKAEKLRPDYPGDPREIDESIESFRNTVARYKDGTVKAVVPDTSFDDQYILELGGRTFKMFHNTPSYSASDIIIAVPEEKVLIVGDIFNKNRLPFFNPQTDLASWEKLFSDYVAEGSDTKYVIGTHGDVMTVDDVREQLKYLRKLVEDVRRIHEEGKSSAEAIKALALATFPYLSKFNPYFYGMSYQTHNLNIDAIWTQLRLSPAEARRIIADGNRAWGRARVALDKQIFERMLAPDFYVQLPGRRLMRQEFIDGISVEMPGSKLTRFDATVLTVQPTADGWVAIIHEKMEIERPDGKVYSLWITRDGWKKVDNQWLIAFSEAIGSENWSGGAKPPLLDW